jgi:4-amino-4-deoxy-L-arabinose transferase-like glycosyltransferase
VYSEGPYATLLLTAIYVTLCAMSRPSIRLWCLAGAIFGLAFLVRQEAFAALMLAALFALTSTEGKLTIRSKRAIAAVAVFLVFASPEILSIYHSTGKLRMEAKSSINLPLAIGMLARGGTPDADHWMSFGVDNNLERTGIMMRPNADVVRKAQLKIRDTAHLIVTLARRNMPNLFQELSSRWMGAPFLPALALLGAVRRPWRGPLASSRLFVLLIPITAVLATFSIIFIAARYYFILVPFLLIWAANGLVEIGLWTNASLSGRRWCKVSPVVPQYIVVAIVGIVLITYPTKGVRELWEFMQGSPARNVEKDVGQWIRQQQDDPVTIMDRDTSLAFHADAEFVWFPYCNGDVALRFLDDARVDYVILRRGATFTQYYEDGLKTGIPDSRAQLVYTSAGANPGEIVVYR